MHNIGAAVIACGKAGQTHMHWYTQNPASRLVGIYDPDDARAGEVAARFNTRSYPSIEALLADPQVQLVSVAGPGNVRAEQVIQACQAGKHVVAEKPMASSLAEARAMLASAHENKVRLFVYLNMRFHPVTLAIDEIIHEIGPLFHVALDYTQFRTNVSWRHKLSQRGGVLKEQGFHPIDLAMRWYGDVQEVSAETLVVHPGREVEDHAVCLLRFQSGATGTIYASYNDRREEAMFGRILGRDGTILFTLSPYKPEINEVILRKDSDKLIPLPSPQTIDPTYPGLMDCSKKAIDHILASLIEGTPSLLDGEEGLKSLEIVLAGYQSQRAHEKVRLPLESFSFDNIEACFPKLKD